MIDLYFFPSPNGLKLTLMLEECGLPYRIVPVDIAAGAQFEPAFLAVSPNNKVPALIDHDAPGGPLSLFESAVMLEYLADKAGRFLPPAPRARWQVKQWLIWQAAGLGPMAGQAHHFRAFAPQQVPYGIERYTREVNRLYGVLERQLAGQAWVCGDISIADFAIFPWIMPHERQGQQLADFPQIARWFAAMQDRPGVQRALALGHEKLLSAAEYRLLLGQTAASVAAEAERRGP